MLDFWYVLGSAVIDLNILPTLREARPEFVAVNRVIMENGVTVYPANGEISVSGSLKPESTTRMRAKIQSLIPPAGPKIPTSIHAAGKMQQLLALEIIGFDDNMRIANTGFRTVCQTRQVEPSRASFSPLFPALVGAAMLDANLRVSLADAPGSDADPILAEFGIDPGMDPDLGVISALAANTDFQNAQAKIIASAGWPTSCGSQIWFWTSNPGDQGANARAILP